MYQDFESDLPDELQGGRVRVHKPVVDELRKETILAQLGQLVGDLRDKAVKARKESGVEEIWAACEEAYLGIDDANRHEFAGAKWIKPTSMSGPVREAQGSQDNTKSTVYIRLTSRYVDMATAKISEIALPIDDKAFSIQPTPVPELINALNSDKPVLHPETGQQIVKPGQAPEAPGQPGSPPKPLTEADIAQQEIDKATDCAEKAEKRIWDWMSECHYPGEMRTVLHDSARLGTAVIKGPFPEMVTTKSMSRKGNAMKMTVAQKSSLAAKWIDVWNFFPDGACGEDIHTGDHVFERDFISKSTLKRMKKQADSSGKPIYLAAQIDKVLEEGPGKCKLDGANPALKVNENRFEIWYMTGTIKRSDLQAADTLGLDELPEEIDDVYCVITLVNDTVIRATVNTLETGNFPYRVLPWSRRAGSWTGVGVAEQVSVPQRIVNGSTRALLNNAGVTSGSQIIIDPIGLVPADGQNVITPLKVWHRTPDASSMNVRDLMASIDIPNHVEQLMAIIQYGMKLAEEASSIPLIAQGQTGDTSPQTFGQAELQNNNGNALLRSIGMRIDDFITGPLVEDFYEMLLLDPNVPDDEKGDFKIVANGTMAMVEKAIQEQTMLQAANLTQNPQYGINPRKWFAEFWKSKRLDPRKIQYTEDELAKMAAQPPQPPPAIAVAEINAKKELQKTQMVLGQKDKQAQEDRAAESQIASMDNQTEQTKIQSDTDRDTAYNNSLAQRDEIARQSAREKHDMQMQLETLKYANLRQISLDDAKKDLAGIAMKLSVQKELSAIDRAAGPNKPSSPSAIAPPTEPEGRAPNGRAFEA